MFFCFAASFSLFFRMYKVYLLLLFCSSGLSVRVVCWPRVALVCGDVLVYIGSSATVRLFAKDFKNDDFSNVHWRTFQVSPECTIVNLFLV